MVVISCVSGYESLNGGGGSGSAIYGLMACGWERIWDGSDPSSPKTHLYSDDQIYFIVFKEYNMITIQYMKRDNNG